MIELRNGELMLLRARNSFSKKDQVLLHFVQRKQINLIETFQSENPAFKAAQEKMNRSVSRFNLPSGTIHGFVPIYKKNLADLLSSGQFTANVSLKGLTSLPVRTAAGRDEGWVDLQARDVRVSATRVNLEVTYSLTPNKSEEDRGIAAIMQDRNGNFAVCRGGKIYRRVNLVARLVNDQRVNDLLDRNDEDDKIEFITADELLNRGLVSAPKVEDAVENAVNVPA